MDVVCRRIDVADEEDGATDGEEGLELPAFQKHLAALELCKRMCDSYTFPSNLRVLLFLAQRPVRLSRSRTTKLTTYDFSVE